MSFPDDVSVTDQVSRRSFQAVQQSTRPGMNNQAFLSFLRFWSAHNYMLQPRRQRLHRLKAVSESTPALQRPKARKPEPELQKPEKKAEPTPESQSSPEKEAPAETSAAGDTSRCDLNAALIHVVLEGHSQVYAKQPCNHTTS